MTVIKWRPGPFGWQRNPFSEMESFQREMNRLFDSFYGTRGPAPPTGVYPPVNVSEDGDNLYVRAELPGVVPEDIEIITQENDLIIKGERKISTEGEKVAYHRREREAGKFQRIIALPTRVDDSRITAVCKNGVLTVVLPKAAEVKPRKITVKTS